MEAVPLFLGSKPHSNTMKMHLMVDPFPKNNRSTELRFLIPLDIKIGHFVDILPSQALRLVLTKLIVTQQKQTFTHKPKDTITPRFDLMPGFKHNWKNCAPIWNTLQSCSWGHHSGTLAPQSSTSEADLAPLFHKSNPV